MKERFVINKTVKDCVQINKVWLHKSISLLEAVELCEEAKHLSSYAVHKQVFACITGINVNELEKLAIGATKTFDVDDTSYFVTRISENFVDATMQSLSHQLFFNEIAEEEHDN